MRGQTLRYRGEVEVSRSADELQLYMEEHINEELREPKRWISFNTYIYLVGGLEQPWAQVLPASGAALADPWVVRFALRLVAPMDEMPPAQAGQSA